MIWAGSTRSTFQTLKRIINARKFYAVLPKRLDRAEKKWHEQQPDERPTAEITEASPDDSEAQALLGGALRSRYKFFKKDGKV